MHGALVTQRIRGGRPPTSALRSRAICENSTRSTRSTRRTIHRPNLRKTDRFRTQTTRATRTLLLPPTPPRPVTRFPPRRPCLRLGCELFSRPPRPRTSTHGARGSEAAGRGAGSPFDHAKPVLRPRAASTALAHLEPSLNPSSFPGPRHRDDDETCRDNVHSPSRLLGHQSKVNRSLRRCDRRFAITQIECTSAPPSQRCDCRFECTSPSPRRVEPHQIQSCRAGGPRRARRVWSRARRRYYARRIYSTARVK